MRNNHSYSLLRWLCRTLVGFFAVLLAHWGASFPPQSSVMALALLACLLLIMRIVAARDGTAARAAGRSPAPIRNGLKYKTTTRAIHSIVIFRRAPITIYPTFAQRTRPLSR
ncbi:MAG TPA: hypothetical protein VJZ77_22105 [Blastocatellia bacterium]|nr:hypothetical protein [Blastocatellia bacterium]